MEKQQGSVGVHRIWDLTQDPKEKALLPGFSWASHKFHVTHRGLGAVNSQGVVVGQQILPNQHVGLEIMCDL